MAAEPNIAGMARLLYFLAGAALIGWGLWGADQGWTQWTWLILGGVILVLAIIGYSPLHVFAAKKNPKAA